MRNRSCPRVRAAGDLRRHSATIGVVGKRAEVLAVAQREGYQVNWEHFARGPGVKSALLFTLWVAPVMASFSVVRPGQAAEPAAAAIDAVAQRETASKPQSGMSLAIAHGGRITYERGFGVRDNGTPDRFIAKDTNYYGLPVKRAAAVGAPADAQTIYAIGSVTRQFTAAAILLLNQQQNIGLDDAVGRYAPEFRGSALTVRELLNQRSGLPDLNTLSFMQRVRPLTTLPDGSLDDQRVSRYIAQEPSHFTPGTRFEYSSSNYFVLGTIVERVARQPLGAFFATRLFRPLGMTRTAYARTATRDDIAVGYRVDEHGAVRRAYAWDLRWLGGAGALTSTAGDLARWNIALMAHRVLAPASLAQMWRGVDAGGGDGAYAMGWIEDALGSHRYLWHNGEVGGFRALNVVFPDDDLAFSVLTNNQDARPEYLVPQLAALYFPVRGLDRVLPRSAIVRIQASLAIGVGALAIAVVAIVTFKRWIIIGLIAAAFALIVGFFAPSFLGYMAGFLAALVPVAGYLLILRFTTRPSAPKS